MKDTKFCPICKVKLKSQKMTWILNGVQRANRLKICPGFNHLLTFYLNDSKVVFLKISLDNKSRIEIDYLSNTSKIIYPTDTIEYFTPIPKIYEPDFPNLTEMKEALNVFLAFS